MDGYITDEYFAGLDPHRLIGELLHKVEDFDKFCLNTGRLGVWSRSYNYYNRGIYKDARINRVGEQSEYTEVYINHYRNLLIHILNMTCNQRPSFDARATNTDFQTQSQTLIATGILDYYNRFKGMDKIAKQAVEDVLTFADAYVYQGWDFSLGDPAVPDPNSPGGAAKNGDILHKNFMPMDCIFDFTAGLHDAPRQWYILRDFKNKWDLIARFPEMKDKILSLSANDETWQYMRIGYRSDYPTDMIPFFVFMHERTDSMPNGRYFTFLGTDCYFVDSELPKFYKTLPLHHLSASVQRGSGFSYSIAYDLLPIQQLIDGLYSIVATNQSTFGVQNILVPNGANIGVQEITDGLNIINYDPKNGKPEALNLTSTPEEIFLFIQRLEQVMETISGVNSVARGNPEQSLKSGSALALVQSMAIQFISGLQQSYTNLLEELGTGVINILKECATTPRMVEISGKSNKSYMDQFTKDDISTINRVTVDVGNPIARTTAGKVSMADNLLQANMLKSPEEYIQILSTGKLEVAIEGEQKQITLVKDENEQLMEGQQVQVVMTDNHLLHIMEHSAVIASTEARKDANAVNATIAHIQQHLELWKDADPALLMALKIPPPPPPPMMPMPGPEQGAPPIHPAAVNGAHKPLLAASPIEAQAAKVRMPSMPQNPMNKAA